MAEESPRFVCNSRDKQSNGPENSSSSSRLSLKEELVKFLDSCYPVDSRRTGVEVKWEEELCDSEEETSKNGRDGGISRKRKADAQEEEEEEYEEAKANSKEANIKEVADIKEAEVSS